MDPPGAVPYIDGPHVGALNNSPSADATTSKPENMKKGKQKVKLKKQDQFPLNYGYMCIELPYLFKMYFMKYKYYSE